MAVDKKAKVGCQKVKPCVVLLLAVVFLLLILQNVSKYFVKRSRISDGLDPVKDWKDVPPPKPAPEVLEKLRLLGRRLSVTTTRRSASPTDSLGLLRTSLSPTPSKSSIPSRSQQVKKTEYVHSVPTSVSSAILFKAPKPLTVNTVAISLVATKYFTAFTKASTRHTVKFSLIPTTASSQAFSLSSLVSFEASVDVFTTKSSKLDGRVLLPTEKGTESEKGVLVPNEDSGVSGRNCSPGHHVMFLKTHKTGGSTITNILNRYADEHDLIIAVPRPGYNRFYYPSLFSTGSVDRTRIPKSHPNILCNHARYKQDALESVMSKNTAFITILRDPVSNFESVFYYMEIPHSCGISGNDNINMITKFLSSSCFQRLRGSSTLIKNGMLFDLGLSASEHSDINVVKTHIENLAKRFQLVLIMEYFDESLVLLKRRLCWKLEDVAYFPFLKSATKRKELPLEIKKKIRNWSRGDIMLYEHFNRTFWQKVADEGEGFYEEVEQLRKLNQELKGKCTDGEYAHLGHAQTYSHVTSFRMNKNVGGDIKARCCRMLRSEVSYIRYHRQRQTPGRTGSMPAC